MTRIYEVWDKGNYNDKPIKLGEFNKIENALLFKRAYTNQHGESVEIYVFIVSENIKKKLFKLQDNKERSN